MMNKHLEDLAIECCSQMVWDSPNPPSEFTFTVNDMKKFAELIVRECAEVANEHDCNLSGNAGEILNHFGVE